MAECRSQEEATDASQGSSPPGEIPHLSPILEVGQDSQRTSSVINDTSPTLQPVTISPYASVTIDTQTHSARTVNVAHPQCAATQPTISTPALQTPTQPHKQQQQQVLFRRLQSHGLQNTVKIAIIAPVFHPVLTRFYSVSR